MKKIVLGVKIDDISKTEATEIIARFLASKEDAFGKGKYYIVTPNPEIIVAAQEDPVLKQILNQADLAIPDGIGLKLVGVNNRISGIDFMLSLVKLAANNGYSVGFVGGKGDVAQETANVLLKAYPTLHVTFFSEDLRSKVSKTDILFVGLGHGKQEKWIKQNLDQIPVKIAMVVGGSFDMISGKVRRAPQVVRNIGLEWLFRLIIQPWRIKRQFALIKYLWLLFSPLQ